MSSLNDINTISVSVSGFTADEYFSTFPVELSDSVTLKPEASKAIFAEFAQIFFDLGGEVIDSQIYTDHIARFGGKNISRSAFLRLEKDLLFTKPKSSVIEHFQNHFS